MPDQFDVIVIGGGPGGSTAARILATNGFKTIVLDRAQFPRLKVCAGWITPSIFSLLGIKPQDYTGGTLQRFQSGSVVVDGKIYETNFPRTASFGIIRQEFDHFLLKKAEAAGAEVRQGIRLREIERQNGSVRAVLEGETLTARMVIGAGGTGCPVARKWGEKRENETIIVAAESETKIGADKLRQLTPYFGTTELFPEDDYYGYAWYVTKGDWVNIGIGRFQHRTKNLNRHRQKFMDKLRGMGRLEGIEEAMVPFSGHSYKLYDEVPRRKSGEKFLLVGDAAGFATKWAGEGIKPAVHSALLAARVAARALKADDTGSKSLSEYVDLCDEAFGRQEKTLSGRILSGLPASAKNVLARQICVRDGLRRKFIFEKAFGFEAVDF